MIQRKYLRRDQLWRFIAPGREGSALNLSLKGMGQKLRELDQTSATDRTRKLPAQQERTICHSKSVRRQLKVTRAKTSLVTAARLIVAGASRSNWAMEEASNKKPQVDLYTLIKVRRSEEGKSNPNTEYSPLFLLKVTGQVKRSLTNNFKDNFSAEEKRQPVKERSQQSQPSAKTSAVKKEIGQDGGTASAVRSSSTPASDGGKSGKSYRDKRRERQLMRQNKDGAGASANT